MPIDVFCRLKNENLNYNKNKNSCNININYNKKSFNFSVTDIWNNMTNCDIVHELLQRSYEYNNTYFIAFGYTGSGKTYTTMGILKELIDHYKNKNLECIISTIQIYNENVYDVLNNNAKLKYFKTDELVINNISYHKITDSKLCVESIKRNRSTASTIMNNSSSRSHAIITLKIGDKKHIIVDMAGQESSVTGNKLNALSRNEGSYINLNMLALKECIRNYNKNKKHIPFRRCLLTLALKPMFYNKCYVSFISTISGEHSTYFKIDSLKYASALFKPSKNNDKIYFELFKNYTMYVQETGVTGCNEREIWKQMKEGNYKNVNLIESYCNSNLKAIKLLKEKMIKINDIINNN